jgi:hypothetical protein
MADTAGASLSTVTLNQKVPHQFFIKHLSQFFSNAGNVRQFHQSTLKENM